MLGMLRWILRTNYRVFALESYASRFDVAELGHLSNVATTGIYVAVSMGRSPNPSIELATFLTTALFTKRGTIPDTAAARRASRRAIRMALARQTTAGLSLARTGAFLEFMAGFRPFRHEEPELDDKTQQRLSYHSTMMLRILLNPKGAPLLPELDLLGEGRAWETSWRPR